MFKLGDATSLNSHVSMLEILCYARKKELDSAHDKIKAARKSGWWMHITVVTIFRGSVRLNKHAQSLLLSSVSGGFSLSIQKVPRIKDCCHSWSELITDNGEIGTQSRQY